MGKLKELRKKLNLYQSDVAERLGVVQSTVSAWETGKSYPRRKLFLKLAEIYNCTIGDLFDNTTQPIQPIQPIQPAVNEQLKRISRNAPTKNGAARV